MYYEPEIIINGENMGPGCAATIRVAIECLATDLHENRLGDDEHGKIMTINYLNRINDIRRIMALIPRRNEMQWINVKDVPAPKQGKFLFSYHCGVGLGAWEQAYTTINRNSERTHELYFLVLWPMDISENDGEPFQWDERKMIEMNVCWLPLDAIPVYDKDF